MTQSQLLSEKIMTCWNFVDYFSAQTKYKNNFNQNNCFCSNINLNPWGEKLDKNYVELNSLYNLK